MQYQKTDEAVMRECELEVLISIEDKMKMKMRNDMWESETEDEPFLYC